MIDMNYANLDKYIRERCNSQGMADNVLTYGVGLALGRVVDIPGRQDASNDIVFEEHGRTLMNQLVNSFNEKLPFDTDAAIELGRYTWLLRYNLSSLGPDAVMEIPVVESKAPFIVSFAGMSGDYNHNVNEFCDKNQTVMTTVVNRCMLLMRDIVESLHA